jgi:hypothetical protein
MPPRITSAASSGFDSDSGGPRTGLGLYENLHVVSEGHKKMHETLNGETFELVIEERRNFWLVDSELSCDLSLGEPLALDNPIESGAEPRFGLEFGSIGKAQIKKNIAAAAGDLIC